MDIPPNRHIPEAGDALKLRRAPACGMGKPSFCFAEHFLVLFLENDGTWPFPTG
jgi:hypothetical protein